MVNTDQGISLKSRIVKTEPVNWREFDFIQQDQFKELSPEARGKLKASILGNNFTQPFYVWQDPETGRIYCLDGKHRTLILEELVAEGYDIPYLLPATFIRCEDKTDAAHLVLIYSSLYAKITAEGLFNFIEAYELGYEELKDQIDLPDFSLDRFEQKFDLYQVHDEDNYDLELDPDEEILGHEGDLFLLGNHRVICGRFQDKEVRSNLMNGAIARILICDPPYNLPVDFFMKDNKKVHNHEDFAMGAGEMSDAEFSVFLEHVMQAAKENTLQGAIHYIFMDHRHGWHMCDAAYRVYGSPIPKQVCTWVKDLMANGSFYRAQQELCFIFSDRSAKALWHRDLIDEGGFYKPENELCYIFKNGDGAKHLSHLDMKDRIRTNVWRYPSSNSHANPDRYELKNHPTPKPVAMIADAVLDTTNPGDGVIDWFLGSGTTVIACEKTGRRCFATEIKPKYVQSTIRRYVLFCEKNSQEVKFTHVNGSLTLNDFIHEPN